MSTVKRPERSRLRPSAICPHCSERHQIRGDGTFTVHGAVYGKRKPDCPGSHEEAPEES